jgi:hypothetical protein
MFNRILSTGSSYPLQMGANGHAMRGGEGLCGAQAVTDL